MTIFGVNFLVQNLTNNILGKVTKAFDLIVEGLRMATKSYIWRGHKIPHNPLTDNPIQIEIYTNYTVAIPTHPFLFIPIH